MSRGRRDLLSIAREPRREAGDAIAGEQIIAQARNIGKSRVLPGTGTHQIQETALRSNVLCVIDRPFRLRDEAVRLKS
jgi:hypothetical protein